MIKKFKLSNGIRVVCEKITHIRSVSIGVWVKTGSRNENIHNNGVSHFIEHMLFKGTQKRSAADIAESIDNIGGLLNAFTGKECTCYYTKTLDEHLDIAIDVLSDMLYNSAFRKKDIALEKRVILEEIGMYEDSPEELVHDILSETVWKGSAIGYPILGTRRSLRSINREVISEYMRSRYTPDNMVISVAGNFDEIKLKEMLESCFNRQIQDCEGEHEVENVEFKPDICVREKDTEQAHICIGFNGIKNGDENTYPLLAVNNIFGGGMSSRLFQRIREKRGLAYSIYSYPTFYNDAGLFTIYAGTSPENLNKVVKLINDEIRLILKNGICEQEAEKSREQLKGSFILGLESTSSRMSSIGKSELLLEKTYTQEEILEKIENISTERMNHVIRNIFNPEKAGISIVGKIKNSDLQFTQLWQ